MASAKKIGRGVEESVGKALANISASAPKPDMKGSDTELKSAVAPKNDLTFKEAFKANRMAGNKTFTWGGKSYNTKMAGEGPKRSGTAPAKPAVTPAKPAATAAKPTTTAAKPAATPAKPAATPAKTRTSKDRSAEARERMGKFFSSLNPYNQADAKGKSGRPILLTGDAAREANRKQGTIGGKPAAKSSGRPLLLTGDAAREENRKQGTIGGKAKGGKIDGAAIRGKTRAPLKKGK